MGTVCYTGGGSGTDLSMVTATASDVFPGKVFVDKDGNEITGTGTSDATATTGYIYSGKTAYVNGEKITGTMTVGSILNFSAAVYSGRQVLLKWQNPYAATGKPFGGVFINYSTNPYPEIDGTMIYTGYGNNNCFWRMVTNNNRNAS